ncbi:MAG: ribosomal RNA small subunit methyltransferase A [Elusimicrobia bacterium CG08_land_8_20_14_0_20_44_26]|nr:MAG: ribosomal RNA small subunit methyltransferase A [Elusimicrobia bacterium CG08_land_8_20_14_0_20_44_26]
MAQKFGQHFLTDTKIIKKIISLLPSNRFILEIGPGRGALTEQLIKISRAVVCVEKDARLADFLKDKFKSEKLKIIKADILKTENVFDEPFSIISNLPYSITTEMIYRLASWNGWDDCVLTVQKEAARRILSEAGRPEYGRSSVTAGVFFKGEEKFSFSRQCFTPPPSVDASVIKFENKKLNIDIGKWRKFLAAVFFSKRKILLNNLKRAGITGGHEILKKAGIKNNARPHQVSPGDFLCLFRELDF